MSEDKSKVLAALNEMMKRLESISRERKEGIRYEFVSYDSLIDEVRPIAVELGLNMLPHSCKHTNSTTWESARSSGSVARNTGSEYIFTFRLYHLSGQWLDIETPSIGIDDQDKGPGKAVTYAAKSAWLQVLMLRRGDASDPDKQTYGQRPQQQYNQTPRQQHTPPPARPPAQPTSALADTYTEDPATWKEGWRESYLQELNYAKSDKAIADDPDFDWKFRMEHLESNLKPRGYPSRVMAGYLKGVCSWLVFTALKTKHERKTAESVQANIELFKRYVGPEAAAKVVQSMPKAA